MRKSSIPHNLTSTPEAATESEITLQDVKQQLATLQHQITTITDSEILCSLLHMAQVETNSLINKKVTDRHDVMKWYGINI